MEMWNIEGAGLPFNETFRKPEKTVNNPNGYGTWVIMLFTTPFEVRLRGQSYEGRKGDILINRPDTPMWHRGVGMGYQNYWIHFYGITIKDEIERYSIPIDIPFTPRRDYSISFREIHWESIEKPAYFRESISRNLQNLILSLYRESTERGENPSSKDNKRRDDLLILRRRISRELTIPWTITLMAKEVALSPSRLAALYKEFFGISPLNDLNRFRLEYARQLLSNPSISIKQAAWESGFRDLPYFNRFFKARMGESPGKWRQSGDPYID